jgi:hypothetical protein
MPGNKKIVLSLITGLLLSGLALYITFKNIPIAELVAYLKSVNYWWVIPAAAIALISFSSPDDRIHAQLPFACTSRGIGPTSYF